MREEILGRYPAATLRVYAVWFNMLWSDHRSRWPQDMFNDARVTQFWDEERVIGTWYGRDQAQVMWDIYALYAPESRWEERPSHLVSGARPIVAGTDRFARDIARLLDESR